MEALLKKLYRRWVRLSPHWKGITLSILIVGGILAIPGFVRETSIARLHQADLYFLETPTVGVGQTFPVELRMKTNGTPVNAMGFTLIYNPLYVEILNITTENSFCTFYLDNTYDNQAGTVKVSCGAPRPGFLGDSLAVRLTMRGRIAGTPAIETDPNTVKLLANDGKGSNIVSSSPKLTLHIQQL